MRRACLLSVLFLLAGPAVAGPAEAVAASFDDARRLGPAAPYARYLWQPAPVPRAFVAVLNGHVNGLSTDADFARLRPVALPGGGGLWALDVRDYGAHWAAVYEKLAGLDPYFHTRIDREEWHDQEYGNWYGPDGRVLPRSQGGVWKTQSVRREKRKVKKADALFVPSAPKEQLAALAAVTNSAAPLLRADWFFAQTARQIDRNNVATGAGYYDFLGIKNERDLEDLAGIDRRKAERARHDIAAIIESSGVAINNRQVIRVAEGYWETRDVDKSVRGTNALRQLNGDFQPVAALEVYFRLPNSLWGLAAVKGEDRTLQASVPDSIAPDSESSSNDHRIHPGLSCVRCHVEGLRPLDDWARKFYKVLPADQPQARLQGPGYEKLKRLRQLYLGPMLGTYYEVDQLVYARALSALTGLTPQQYARAYGRIWREYADTAVSGERFAAELGTTLPELKKALAAAAEAQKQLDPVLTGYLKVPEFAARRVHVEEVYPAAALAVAGLVAP